MGSTHVARMLSLRVYLGEVHQGDLVVPGAHEALTDEATFAAAQVAQRSRPRRSPSAEFHLRGVIRCAGCGFPMAGWNQPRQRADGAVDRVRVYRCVRQRMGGACTARAVVMANAVEQVVRDLAEPLVRDFAATTVPRDRESDVAAELARVETRLRGVSIRAFLEQDYLLSPKIPTFKPKGGESDEKARRRAQWEELRRPPERKTNRDIAAALLRCDVDLKSDYNPSIFHKKFAIRDYRGRASKMSALLTGSANWTDTDFHRNLNHTIVFHDPAICAEYEREFDEIRAGSFGRRQHATSPARGTSAASP